MFWHDVLTLRAIYTINGLKGILLLTSSVGTFSSNNKIIRPSNRMWSFFIRFLSLVVSENVSDSTGGFSFHKGSQTFNHTGREKHEIDASPSGSIFFFFFWQKVRVLISTLHNLCCCVKECTTRRKWKT